MSVPRTVAAYADRFLAAVRHRVKFRTWNSYEQILRVHVIPALRPDTPLVNITRAVVRDFVTERLRAGYAPRTVRTHLRGLSALLTAAVDEELLDANPATRLGRAFPRRPSDPRAKALPREALERLLAAARRRDVETGALLLVLARTGLRVGEALALRWQDAELDARVIHVRHSLDYRGRLDTPKSGRARDVDLSPQAAECLCELRTAAPAAVPWVFASPAGRPWSRSHVRRTMHRAAADAGLSPCSAHVLRHTFASGLADAGVSPWAIRDLLGHHDIAVTQVYVHQQSRHLEAVELLDDPARA